MISSESHGDPGKQLLDLIGRATRNIVGHVAEEVQQNILRNAEGRILRVRTGTLVQAWSGPIRVQSDPRTGDWMAVVAPARSLPYLRIHEFGGTIVPNPSSPKYTGWLHFRTEDGGWIKTKRVQMPARHYLSISIEQTRPEVDRLAKEAIDATRDGQDWFGRNN